MIPIVATQTKTTGIIFPALEEMVRLYNGVFGFFHRPK